jgi:hypothetical protein
MVATVTVTNNGPGPLANVTASFQPGGNGFSAQVSSACQNLAQGGNCAVTVNFSLAPGSASLPITNLILTPQGGTGSVSIPVSISRAATSTSVIPATVTYSTSSQTVMLNATITSPVGTVDEGTVTFTIGGASITSGPVSNGSASVSYTVPAGLAAGTSYPIQAVYSGGPLFSGSSGSGTLTINKADTTTTASDSTVQCNTSGCVPTAPLNATVTSPAGTVDGGSVTFTVTDTASPGNPVVVGTLSNVPVKGGHANGTLAPFNCTNANTYNIVATYVPSPSSNFKGSTSQPATLFGDGVCG